MPCKRQQEKPHLYVEVACPTCGNSRLVARYKVHLNQLCIKCSKKQTARTRRKRCDTTTSKLRGVYYRADRARWGRPWVANIKVDGRLMTLAYAGTEEAAGRIYDYYSKLWFGPDGFQNFPAEAA